MSGEASFVYAAKTNSEFIKYENTIMHLPIRVARSRSDLSASAWLSRSLHCRYLVAASAFSVDCYRIPAVSARWKSGTSSCEVSTKHFPRDGTKPLFHIVIFVNFVTFLTRRKQSDRENAV